MNFSEIEKQSILTDFPNFELSYETMVHKKVHNADIMLAIPHGIKYLAWFSSYKDKLVCFLLELTDSKKIKNIKTVITSFDDKLSLGTIFYGTVVNYNGINCFSIEDLYYYKGKNYTNSSYLDKIDILKNVLRNELSQNVLTKNYTVFGLPLMSTDFYHLLKEIEFLPYKVGQIKFRFFDKNNSKKIVYINYFKPRSDKQPFYKDSNITNKCVFKIIADIEPDIYHLFVNNNGKEEYYDVASIPDYKTSVMMNKLFRKIKENDNLDALEESDTEEEFEDRREDKYVYLDRSFLMICEYNSKFKRYYPISLASKNDRLTSLNQLLPKKY